MADGTQCETNFNFLVVSKFEVEQVQDIKTHPQQKVTCNEYIFICFLVNIINFHELFQTKIQYKD